MRKYIIEREVPGIGSLNAQQLQGASATSCDALRKIGTSVQWIHSSSPPTRPSASIWPTTSPPSAATPS